MSPLFDVRVNPKNGALKEDSMMENYDREFRHLQQLPVNLLELGIYGGGSLKIWERFFPHGTVSGIDRNVPAGLRDEKKIKCFMGDQQDTEFLDRVAAEVAPQGFDIIIDDCAHIGELAKTSFWHLFENHLKPGGIYAIEDWLTAYMPGFPDGCALAYDPKDVPAEEGKFHGHQHGMAGFLKELIDEFARHAYFTPMPDSSKQTRIAQIKFFQNQAFIYKPAPLA